MENKRIDLISRQDIYQMRERGKSLREIGKQTGFHYSSISRELMRNGPRDRREECAPACVQASLAQKRAEKRQRVERRPRMRLKCPEIRQLVSELIKPEVRILSNGKQLILPGLTPEQIAAEVPKRLPGKSISHEAIYQYLLLVARELIQYLPKLGSCRRRRTRTEKVGRRKLRQAAVPKKHISQRPAAAETLEEFGHYERDAIVSCRGGEGGLQNIIERKSRYAKLRKLERLDAKTGREATIEALRFEAQRLKTVRSITNDNGSENLEWASIEKILGTEIYFCTAYAAYQRGINERSNETFRKVFPKGTNFADISAEEVAIVEAWYNNRPLGVLKYRTPKQVYDDEIALLGQKAA
jgi:IS30 family transposase